MGALCRGCPFHGSGLGSSSCRPPHTCFQTRSNRQPKRGATAESLGSPGPRVPEGLGSLRRLMLGTRGPWEASGSAPPPPQSHPEAFSRGAPAPLPGSGRAGPLLASGPACPWAEDSGLGLFSRSQSLFFILFFIFCPFAISRAAPGHSSRGPEAPGAARRASPAAAPRTSPPARTTPPSKRANERPRGRPHSSHMTPPASQDASATVTGFKPGM